MKTVDEAMNDWCASRGRPAILMNTSFIWFPIVKKFQDLLHDKSLDALDVVLETPGGYVEAAYQIVRLLRRHAKVVTGIVPSEAMSAGTLLSLGMDELILGELGHLGPLDTQIAERKEGEAPEYSSALRYFTALEEIRKYALETFDLTTQLVKEKAKLRMSENVRLAIALTRALSEPLLRQLNPIQVAESSRANNAGIEYGTRVLTRCRNFQSGKAKQILNALVQSYPAHDFVLDEEELTKLGVPARQAKGVEIGPMKGLSDVLYFLREDFVGLYPKVTSVPKKPAAPPFRGKRSKGKSLSAK